MKEFLKFTYKDFIRNNKNSKKNIIIFSLLILLIICCFSFFNVIHSYVNRVINKNIDYRTLNIVPEDDDFDINELKNISHIENVFSSSSYSTSVYVEDFSSGIIFLRAYTDSVVLSKGDYIQESNDIICPSKLIASSDVETNFSLNSNDYIYTREYLNKGIRAFYEIWGYDSDLPYVKERKELTLNVVGIYNDDVILSDSNVCFASPNLIENLNGDKESSKDDDIIYPSTIESLWLVVDGVDNVSLVKEELSKYGITYFDALKFDFSLIYLIYFISLILAGIVFVILIFCIILFLKNIFRENKKDYAIIRSLGFNDLEIRKFILLENLMLISIAYFIAVIMFTIIYMIVNFIVYNKYVVLAVFKFNYPILFVILLYLLLCLFIYIVTRKYIVEFNKKDISSYLKGD